MLTQSSFADGCWRARTPGKSMMGLLAVETTLHNADKAANPRRAIFGNIRPMHVALVNALRATSGSFVVFGL